jgi:hypothetical protein
VSVAEFSLANVRLIGPIPVSMVVDLKGMAVDVTQLKDAKSQQTFKALGYDKLVVSANVDYAWDQASKAAVFKNISMGIDQGAVLQLSLALDGVDFSQIEQPADAMALMGAVALKRAQIRYQDQSLAGRILKMAAGMQGMQAEDLQTALAAQLEMMAGSMLDDSPDSEKLVEALQTFIKDPKSLTITSEPQPALPVMTLITEAKLSPDQLVKDLKLSLAVNDQAAVKVDKLGPSSGAEGGMPMPMPGTGQAPEAAKKPGTQPQPMPAPGGSSSFSDFFKKGAGTQPGKDGSLEAQPLKKK